MCVPVFSHKESRCGRPTSTSLGPDSIHRPQTSSTPCLPPAHLPHPANTPHTAQGPPLSQTPGLSTAEDTLSVKSTLSSAARPPTHPTQLSRICTHRGSACARTHPRPPALASSLPTSLFLSLCQTAAAGKEARAVSGREAPEKESLPPAAGSTSGLWRRSERGEAAARKPLRGAALPMAPKRDRNAFLSLAPPPLTWSLQSEGALFPGAPFPLKPSPGGRGCKFHFG